MRKILIITVILALAISGCKNKKSIQKTDRVVLIETEYGNMKIKLYDQTPKHRDNFIKLADKGFFDGTLFHRVIDGFMIQGGDPDSKEAKPGQRLGEGGPGYQIDAEFRKELFHKRGVIAAAREGDQVNPERKSAGSQFYIAQGRVYKPEEIDNIVEKINNRRRLMIFENLKEGKNKEIQDLQQKGDMIKLQGVVDSLNTKVDELWEKDKLVLSDEQKNAYTTVGGIPHLDGQYTVFGEVIEGMDVIDKIAAVAKDKYDRPLKNVKMKVKVLE
jgi:cyclophilin family peptidyl-prolyl cis-trans isomerase